MIRYFMIVLILCFIPLTAIAEDGPNLNLTVDYVSKYIFRGVDVLSTSEFDDKPALQPSLEVTTESGLLLNVWASLALSKRDDLKTLDEIDLKGEYSAELGHLLGYTAGMVTYLYPKSQSNDGELAGSSAAEAYASLWLDTVFNPYIMYAYEFMTGNNGYLEFGVEHTQRMKMLGITAAANIGYDNGQFIDDRAISHIDMSLKPMIVHPDFILYGQAHYVIIPDKDVGINDEDEFWFGVGLTSDFILLR